MVKLLVLIERLYMILMVIKLNAHIYQMEKRFIDIARDTECKMTL